MRLPLLKKEIIAKYTKQIPEEIHSAIKAFDSPTRSAIIVYLYESGERTPKELKAFFGMTSKTLEHHLEKLMDGAIVEHYYKHDVENKHKQDMNGRYSNMYPCYGLTEFGRRFLRNMLETLRVKKHISDTVMYEEESNKPQNITPVLAKEDKQR